jgi:hypothetical protein
MNIERRIRVVRVKSSEQTATCFRLARSLSCFICFAGYLFLLSLNASFNDQSQIRKEVSVRRLHLHVPNH